MNAQSGPTLTDLVAKYIALRDKADAIQEQHENALEAALAPYKAALDTLLGVLTGALLELGPDEGKRNISTPAGTVFRKKWTSVKVQDREAFLEFVLNTASAQFLTNHVAKEAVITHMEEHNGVPPPGVGIESGYVTQVRRS